MTATTMEFPHFGKPSPSFRDNPARKVLERMKNGTAGSDMPRLLHALASHLRDKHDLQLLEDFLIPFQTRCPLDWARDHPNLFMRDELNSCRPVIDSMQFLTVLIFTFAPGPTGLALGAYRSAAFPIFLENWPSIVGWLQTLVYILDGETRLTGTGSISNEVRPFDLFRSVTFAYGSSEYGEELLSLPCTVEFVYFLLCRADPRSGRRLGQQSSCSLLTVIGLYTASNTNRQTFVMWLGKLKQAERRSAMFGLVSRARDLADFTAESNTGNYRSSLESLIILLDATRYLIASDPSVLSTFHRCNFLEEYATAMFNSAKHSMSRDEQPTDEQFWQLIAGAASRLMAISLHYRHQNDAIAAIAEGGLLPCAFTALTIMCEVYPSTSPYVGMLKNSMETVCRRLLTSSKIFKAVSTREAQLEHMMRSMPRRSHLKGLCDLFQYSFAQSGQAFKNAQFPANVPCSNLSHPRHPAKNTSTKRCGNCRAVNYCSTDCQKEDWKSLHRQECPILSKAYREQSAQNQWAPNATRQDRLVYIEHLLNRVLPAQKIRWTSDCVLILDVTMSNKTGIKGLSIDDCRKLLWDRVAPEWTPRIEKLVDETRDATSLRLAEVILFNDDDHIAAVLVQVREDCPGHYQTLNTISRVCKPGVMKEIWQKRTEDAAAAKAKRIVINHAG